MPNQGPGGQPPPADQAQELLAMVAHELRRPLTAVRGALATVRHRGHALPASQQQELLGIAHRQAEQMQRLVDQLLVAAALERPRPSPTRWPLVDASPLAEEADRAARLAHPGQQITIEAAGPLLVSADSTAISRILGNLLDNATSHSPPAAPIRLTVARDGQQAVLAVLDHGSGVPSEQCQRIFERYARLEEPAGFAAGGLGLGLYIAWRLARTNRGELSATDPPDGRGARFELRLPLAPHPPHERPAAAGS
jgi:signal transduction histidine kinase